MIRLGALGDVVRTLPAAGSLRSHYPGAELVWLVEPSAAGAVASQPWIDGVLVFPRDQISDAWRRRAFGEWLGLLRAFRRALRARRFDLVLDFHSILKSGVLARASGAKVRVGYAPPFARELSWLFANRRLRLPADRISRFDRNEALVRFLAIENDLPVEPLHLPRAMRLDWRGKLGPAAPVVLHPGTSPHTPYKRYSARGLGAVARALAARRGVSNVVAFGSGAEERASAQAVVDASSGAARLAPPTDRFEELAALLAAGSLFVGADSGPLHVASLVGTPVVQILGPTHPVENRPYAGTPFRQVRVPVSCSPCRRGCAAASCLSVLPPERVVDAALQLLDENAADPGEAAMGE